MFAGRPGIFGISGRGGSGRIGVPKDELANSIPDISQVLCAARGGSLPSRTGVEIKNRIVKKSVLVADDFLESRAVNHRAREVLRLAPGNIVEMIIFESAVEVIGMAESGVGAAVTFPIAVAESVVRNIVEDVERPALPCFDAAVIIAIEHRFPNFIVVD